VERPPPHGIREEEVLCVVMKDMFRFAD